MVDRPARDKLANDFSLLISGEMTNDQFDEAEPKDGEAPGVVAVWKFGYSLYSSDLPYRLKGRHACGPVSTCPAPRGQAAPCRVVGAAAPKRLAAVCRLGPASPGLVPGARLHDDGLVRDAALAEAAPSRVVQAPGPRPEYPQGAGANPLHQAIAHWFNHAPDHYPVSAALRWAQVRGLGGEEPLARAVIATRLGRSFGHEDFWLTVLHFFVTNPKLDVARVGPIVDFLQYQRFGPDEGALVRREPPQPEFSMKGRTVAALLRLVDEWHKQLGRDGAAAGLQRGRSQIGEFEQVEGSEELENLRRWTITQLLSSRELKAEGLAMRHCVAIYAGACARKQTSIWSLRVETAQGQRRLLTVEVDLARRTICQARWICNALPKEKEINLLKEWARLERLQIASQL